MQQKNRLRQVQKFQQIKNWNFLLVQQGKNKTLIADIDLESWAHTYTVLEKRGKSILSTFCPSRFVDAEFILKSDVNC